MNRLIFLLALCAFWAATGNSQTVRAQPQTFVIKGPAIVAFFATVTSADLDNDEDTNEALSDFQFCAGSVRAPLHKAGIDFFDADAVTFKVRIGTRVRTFHAGKTGVGYYLIAPGKKPKVEYGVMTHSDLLDLAREYFGIAIQYERCTGPHCSK